MRRIELIADYACLTGENPLWHPMERRPYHTDSKSREVSVYDYDERTGSLSGRRPFLRLPDGSITDGLTVDAEGFVWCAVWGGGRVARYDQEGIALTVTVPRGRKPAQRGIV